MSIIEELGAQLQAATDDLPVGLVAKALEHLRVATDRLRWVRQESADPLGVPELSAATEHAQMAGHALRVAQDQLAAYRAAIGLAVDGTPAGGRVPRACDHTRADAPTALPPQPPAGDRPVPTVNRWWTSRVAELTGLDKSVLADPAEPATDADELLRRVSRPVGSGDRNRLHAELQAVDADVGLALAAVTAPTLRRLAGQLLGHPPRAEDLPRLQREVGGRIRTLLPGLPPAVLDTLLSRLCRTPPPKNPPRPNPADPAVAAAVLTGLLLHRLDEKLPDPSRKRHG
ncbi:MAG TPA: hypothetical protein VFX61_16610 [Micromonosporaceae bacterium]|nr:hypothetical protein [Micromonosporaceae bacterium]